MQTPEEFAALLDRCAHTAEGMGERLTDTYRVADLIRARDAEVRADERAKVRYVVFDSDWCEPPGDVIAVFATEAEARAHIDGPGDGYGWSVVEVPAP